MKLRGSYPSLAIRSGEVVLRGAGGLLDWDWIRCLTTEKNKNVDFVDLLALLAITKSELAV